MLYFLETCLADFALFRVQQFLGPHWEVYIIPVFRLFGGIIITWKRNLGEIHFMHVRRQVAFGVLALPNEGGVVTLFRSRFRMSSL